MRTLVAAFLLVLGACSGESRYQVAKVERGAISAVVLANGTVNAVSTVQVPPPISGQVKEINADFKTPVKKGQVIARMDPATFEQRVSQARADLDAAKSAPDASRAQIRSREARLKQAEADLERTVIRAPVDGTVVLRNVDAGQTVTASPQAPALFAIAQDLREMRIEAAIDEADAARLSAGMSASFTVDAFPRRTFAGELRQARNHTVTISAPNADLALLPGMTANVRIVRESRASVLKVPNAALRWRPPGIWVLEKGEPKRVAVRTGITDGTHTELVQGPLREGAEVIVRERGG